MTGPEDYDYELPEALIAQRPPGRRDAARLLDATGDAGFRHRRITELPGLLRPDDCLVLNRSEVLPARLAGTKATGGAVEVLLVHELEPDRGDGPVWAAMIRGRVRPGSRIDLAGIEVVVEALDANATRAVRFPPGTDVVALARKQGTVPLPPYIRRDADEEDRERYQTVFADRPGSVAAPTASLHFTSELLDAIAARGVTIARCELAVGPGTFRPVTEARLEDHRLHRERCVLESETVDAIRACRARGGRIVAAGTTVVRVLETAARVGDDLAPFEGWSELFLHPPQRMRVVDTLLTNFHLPRSTLMMLVACLCGRERLLAAYREAIAEGYRFYSYGEAMLVGEGR